MPMAATTKKPAMTPSAEAGPIVEVDDRRSGVGGSGEPAAELGAELAAELAALLSAVLLAEGAPAHATAGLHLVDVAEISELNDEHMGVSGPTDVLSFPLDGPGDHDGPGPDQDVQQIVGDVVLCPDVAVAQASEHAGSKADECRLLVVHGGLHLCGWDHAEPDDRDAMWARERALMAQLGVSPSGDPWVET